MTDPASAPPAADIATLSFEAALAELETIVRQLEAGQVPLDATIGLYERATMLRQHCDARLKDAEMRIERIVAGPDGAVRTTPFDEQG
jgi:exodeoxyribonuclease VII small subunit